MKKKKRLPKPTKYRALKSKVVSKLKGSFDTVQGNSILDQMKAGANTYLKYQRIINTSYDPRWISEIEDCLYDLGEIIKNPKLVTKEVADLVPVEMARKINSESINHLTTHSQYVKEIDEKGDIIPNKILNIGSDDYLQTYENRFIATLVRRLVLFIEKRYQFLEDNAQIKKSKVMMVKNKSIIDGREVEIETKITVSNNELSEDLVNTNASYLARVRELKRYVLYYYNSNFMKAMKTEKNVNNPIIMTNIIRKNPLYNHCYRLYKFVEKYDLMGVNFKVSDIYSKLDERELNDINSMMALNFLSLEPEESIRNPKKKIKKYKPHIVSTTDDETFVYGPYYKGPMEFVRADDQYLKYLDALRRPSLIHPTKQERAYYGDDTMLNKEVKAELQEIAQLLNRKKKDYKAALKEFDRIIYERELELARIKEEQRLRDELEILRQLNEARKALMDEAYNSPEYQDSLKENDPFAKLRDREYVPFLTRLDKAEQSLYDGYRKIRHEALCYGLKSRISKKCETFRLHNQTYIKIALIGKSLKIHYALEPADYADAPFTVKDDSNLTSYKDIPLLFKVRSNLSIKRAIGLIHDLAEKYGLVYTEIPDEEPVENVEEIEETTEIEEEVQETPIEQPVDPFAHLKDREFVPFVQRIENADPSIADAYKKIRHHALCYGLHSRVSKKADTFRLHGQEFLMIGLIGKSLRLHYALDPKNYKDSPIPTFDDGNKVRYQEIPLGFKVRSDLSVKRAIKLIDDLAARYALIYKEIPYEEPVTEEEPVDDSIVTIEPENVDQTSFAQEENNPFANFKRGEFVSFTDRLKNADPSLAEAYKQIRHRALCYGLHSRVSNKGDMYKLHNVKYLRIVVIGKSLKLHYALDPKDYENSPIPFFNDGDKNQYKDIPFGFKVRSDLSVKRAVSLVDDLAKKYGFEYNEIPYEEPVEEEVIQNTPEIQEEVPAKFDPFANLKDHEFVPFLDRFEYLDPSLNDAYKKIRHHAICYGLHARLSKRGETFKLHNEKYLKIAIVGKSLRLHYALDVKDYENSPIPHFDDSDINQYKDIPFGFKVRSDLSVKRAITLIDDLAKKYGFEYNEVPYEEPVLEEEPIVEETQVIEEVPVKFDPFANLKDHEFVPFIDRFEYLDPSLNDAYKKIRHHAICYGLHARLSKRGETFKLHNEKYLKIAIVGKSLRLHYALDVKDYENSPIPHFDDSDINQYKDIPFGFKVRSDLSVKRAITLIDDLAKKYGFEYKEVPYEEPIVEEIPEIEEEPIIEETPVVEEVIEPTIDNPFANFKRGEFVSFTDRLESADTSLVEAYKQIRHQALCYGLHSRVSNKGDMFKLHNVKYLRIVVVGKSLKLHYALDPKDYENSPIPFFDDGEMTQYKEIPFGFKVRSDLSVKRAVSLVDDLAKKYGFEYKEVPFDEPIEEEEIEEIPVEEPQTEEKPIDKFADLRFMKRIPFEDRVASADPELAEAYKKIRKLALSYGLHSRITTKGEMFRLHAVTYLKIAIVGKTLKINYALDPKDYENTTIPVKDSSALSSCKDIPLQFKARSTLSIKRALGLVDDLAKKYGFEYHEVTEEELALEEETPIEEKPIVKEIVKEEPIIEPQVEADKVIVPSNDNPFANFKHNEFVPFEKRIEELDDSLKEAYQSIRDAAIAYGLHSRISKKAEAFRLHAETYIVVSVVGKSLKVSYALDPKDYENSTIPFKNEEDKTKYKDTPLTFKVRSNLSIKRAIALVDDVAKRFNFTK